jgi:hypothetical protein
MIENSKENTTMDNAARFEHKGIEIGLTVTGQFVAQVEGVEVVKKSLEAMKGFIDGNIKSTNAAKFTVFESLTTAQNGEILRIPVTGITKSRKSYGPRYFFTLGTMSRYARETSEVIPDTPENVEAIKASNDFAEETRRIDREREEKQHELNRKITRLTAVDHAAKVGIK